MVYIRLVSVKLCIEYEGRPPVSLSKKWKEEFDSCAKEN